MNWKDKTCGSCTYRIDGKCRFNPPMPIKIKENDPNFDGEVTVETLSIEYPRVDFETPACGQWRDENRSW
jgi:hypothetical protein